MARVYTKVSVADRLERHISRIPIAGCWVWVGAADRLGYGRINVDGRIKLAHRVSFEQHIGLIPAGLDLDHLCRNPSCVNPAHLEPVTRKVNTDRGRCAELRRAIAASAVKCRNGHEYTEGNVYTDRAGRRNCRKCRANAVQRYREKNLVE